MSKVFESKNHEIFETFLIKEREQREVEKIHAQETIKYWGRCFEEEQRNANIFTKIRDFFYDIIDGRKLKEIKKYNEERIEDLLEEELTGMCVKSKVLCRGNFKIHIFLNRVFEERHTMADCGGISYPYLCYQIYMQIEFCELLTQKHYFKEYEDLKEAKTYYHKLINDLKNEKVVDVINTLDKQIDDHCKELNERIVFLRNN